MKDTFKTINLMFDKTVSSVVKIEMIEASEDVTTIDFINKKLNAAIPQELFIIK